MANLNLSQFGENTSVSNADYTFVWDSANSISKKVSRNSWLNSGTLTSDAPVTISQTWNQIGTAFTAFKVNAVSTASATGSLLADFQVGGVSQFSVNKIGQVSALFSISSQYLSITQNASLASDAGALVFGATNSVWLRRDGADNTLALRNGAAAQTFRVYGAYPDTGINYARLALSCDTSGNATISTQALGTYTAGVLAFSPGNSERMRITAAGNVGIGTTSPTSKLQVSAGDVEVDTIAKGVILKSPDGTRYRVTVANGGTLSVAAV